MTRVLMALFTFALLYSVQPALAGPVFNVKDFGAVGDGVNDDGAAIQKALDAAFAAGGATVFFPAGRYFHSKTLKVIESSLLGDSRDTTVLDGPSVQLINLKGSVSKLTITNKSPNPLLVLLPLMELSSVRASMQDVSFIGFGRTALSNSLNLNANNFVLDRCQFVGSFRQLACTRCFETTIQNCIFTDADKGTAISSNNCENLTLTSNQVSRCSTGILVENNTGSRVVQNTIDNCDTGVRLGRGRNLTVEQNKLRNIVRDGIVAWQTAPLIRANDIQLSRQFASVGIDLFQSGAAQLLANTLTNCGLGIVAESGGAGMQIVGNSVNGTLGDGIRVEGYGLAGSLKIDSNVLRDCGLFSRSDVISVGRDIVFKTFTPVITNNQYLGGSNRLRFFIRCLHPSPPAVVTGNTTTTMLPSYVAKP